MLAGRKRRPPKRKLSQLRQRKFAAAQAKADAMQAQADAWQGQAEYCEEQTEPEESSRHASVRNRRTSEQRAQRAHLFHEAQTLRHIQQMGGVNAYSPTILINPGTGRR